MPTLPGEINVGSIEPVAPGRRAPGQQIAVAAETSFEQVARFERAMTAERTRTAFDGANATFGSEVADFIDRINAEPDAVNLVPRFEMEMGARAAALRSALAETPEAQQAFEIQSRTVMSEGRSRLARLEHERLRAQALPQLERTLDSVIRRGVAVHSDPQAIRQEIFDTAAATAATGRFSAEEARGHADQALQSYALARANDLIARHQYGAVIAGVEAGAFDDLHPQQLVQVRALATAGAQRERFSHLQTWMRTNHALPAAEIQRELEENRIDPLQADDLRAQSTDLSRARIMAQHAALLDRDPVAAGRFLETQAGTLSADQRARAFSLQRSVQAQDLQQQLNLLATAQPDIAVELAQREHARGALSDREFTEVKAGAIRYRQALQADAQRDQAERAQSALIAYQNSLAGDPMGVGDPSTLGGFTLEQLGARFNEMAEQGLMTRAQANALNQEIGAIQRSNSQELGRLALANQFEQGTMIPSWSNDEHRKAVDGLYAREVQRRQATGGQWTPDDDTRFVARYRVLPKPVLDALTAAAGSDQLEVVAAAAHQLGQLQALAPSTDLLGQFDKRGQRFAHDVLVHTNDAIQRRLGLPEAVAEGRRKAGLDFRDENVAAQRVGLMKRIGLMDPDTGEVVTGRQDDRWYQLVREELQEIDWKEISSSWETSRQDALLANVDFIEDESGFQNVGDLETIETGAQFRAELKKTMRELVAQSGNERYAARQALISLIGGGRWGIETEGDGTEVWRQWPKDWLGDVKFETQATVPAHVWIAEAQRAAVDDLVQLAERMHGITLPPPDDPTYSEQLEAAQAALAGEGFFERHVGARVWAALDLGDPDVRAAIESVYQITGGNRTPGTKEQWSKLNNPVAPRIRFVPHPTMPADGTHRYYTPELWIDASQSWQPVPISFSTVERDGKPVTIANNFPPLYEFTPDDSITVQRRSAADFREKRITLAEARGAFARGLTLEQRLARDPSIEGALERSKELRTEFADRVARTLINSGEPLPQRPIYDTLTELVGAR